jgi:general secretion pathway protein F
MLLVEAVDTLSSKEPAGDHHSVLLELKQRLLEGKSLSDALALNRFPISPLLIASIRSSERSSRIEEALDEYVAYEKIGQELSRKIISAAIYPSLVIGFGLLVSLFMISYVVPRFTKVYGDSTQSISVPTLILIKVGQLAGDNIGAIMALVLSFGALGVMAYRNGTLKVALLRVLGRFNLVKYYLRLYQLSRVYQTMSMLLRGGYALTEAIPMAQHLAFDKSLNGQIDKALRVVIEGRRLSIAFAEFGLTDHVSERLLQVGERSGNLSGVMDTIAHTYRQEFTLFIDRATRIAEPLLLMVVGLMIGAIIILMYMPVFDLAGGI